jgi:hypothetical protein
LENDKLRRHHAFQVTEKKKRRYDEAQKNPPKIAFTAHRRHQTKLQTPTTVTCRYGKSEHSRLFTVKTQGFYYHFKFGSVQFTKDIYRL